MDTPPCLISHAKLGQFYSNGEYHDVRINVGGRIFNCHRVILAAESNYFHAMFSHDLKERYLEEITLLNVDPEIFNGILEYIYSRKLRPELTFSNVYKFLRTSEFLKVLTVENYCITYILENRIHLREHALGLFTLACALNHCILMNPLREYIAANFCIISKSNAFLEMSFDEMYIVYSAVRCTKSPVLLDEDLVLDRLIQWLRHSCKERKAYFSQLIQMIDFTKISTNYAEFLFREYNLRNESLKDCIMNIAIDNNCSSPAYYSFSNSESFIHMYVSALKNRLTTETVTKVFSVNKFKPDGLISRTMNYKIPKVSEVNFVSDESKYLYFLRNNGHVGLQSFHIYSSTDLSYPRQLNHPPVYLPLYGTYAKQQNCIYYAAGGYLDHDTLRGYRNFQSSAFLDEEIERGVYCYDCKRDMWCSVPRTLCGRMRGASMTVVDSRLYSIGGMKKSSESRSIFMQAYDYRTPNWLELPRSISGDAYISPCCTLNEKIYVNSGPALEEYDPVANQWKKLEWESKGTIYQMLPFENLLWFFSENRNVVGCYDPKSQKWHEPPVVLLNDAIVTKCGFAKDLNKIDYVFLFK